MSKFKYLIALDFEATCEEIQPYDISQRNSEIIEFPAILINLETGQIESEFHQYVKPVNKPNLSSFCTKLTGITQDKIENASNLSEVLKNFENWLKEKIEKFNLKLPESSIPMCITNPKNLTNDINCTFITWSDSDLKDYLALECEKKSINKNLYLNRWIDVQKIYSKICGRRYCKFRDALKREGICVRENVKHSGLYDAKNLAYLAYKIKNKLC